MRTIGLIGCLALAVAASACGSPVNGAPTLVGTWKNASTDMSGNTTTYMLLIGGNDESGTTDFTLTFVHGMAAMDAQANCTATEHATGTFVTANGTLTVTFNSGTVVTAGCTDATKNMAERVMTATELTDLNSHAGGPYTVTATTLSVVSGGMTFTFTRQ
jgi:hypothetical protein